MVEWKKTQMEITTSRGGGRQIDSNREELFPNGITSSVMDFFLTRILLNTQQNIPRIILVILYRKGF